MQVKARLNQKWRIAVRIDDQTIPTPAFGVEV
jgi:hypothetical protein